MMTNEGTVDRAVRILLGVVLLALVFVGPATPWGLIGIVPLVTGLIGFCPLYRVLGLSTCPVRTPS
ncbi:MAG: DUF2892 domain-containing protein [Deltaproteobacteria bacterium]|nr:DUF2892 domain-containing protein [Deltaproteobacteria bacterium]